MPDWCMFVFVCLRACIHAARGQRRQHGETTRDHEKLFVCLSAKMGAGGREEKKIIGWGEGVAEEK